MLEPITDDHDFTPTVAKSWRPGQVVRPCKLRVFKEVAITSKHPKRALDLPIENFAPCAALHGMNACTAGVLNRTQEKVI